MILFLATFLELLQYSCDSSSCTVIGWTPDNTYNVVLPEKLENGTKITRIIDDLFLDDQNLESLTIEANVLSLGNEFCYHCVNLKTVTFGKNVGLEEIGVGCFTCCYQLTSINLEVLSCLQNICLQALCSTAITEITLPRSISSIGHSAIVNCTKLRRVYAGNSLLKTIDSYAFAYNFLEYVELSPNLEKLNVNAFSNSQIEVLCFPPKSTSTVVPILQSASVQKIIFSDGLEAITASAFENNSLICIEFYETSKCKIFESRAFYGNYDLQSVVFPPLLKVIGSYCFYYALFSSIDFPDTLTQINDCAFYYNRELACISFGPGSLLQSIGSEAFRYCWCLERVCLNQSSLTSIGDSAFGADTIEEFIIGKGTSIEFSPFVFQRAAIGKLVIEKDTITFMKGSFKSAVIEKIEFSNSIVNINNEVFASSELQSIYFYKCKVILSQYAFSNCAYLRVLALNDSTITLNDYAFYNCSNLTSLVIPESSSIEVIPSNCFAYSGLIEFECPSTLKTLNQNAFYCCSGLIRFLAGKSALSSIDPTAFLSTKLVYFQLSPLLEVTSTFISYNVETVEYPQDSKATSLPNTGAYNVIPSDSITIIASEACSNSNLQKVAFRATSQLTTISSYSFSKCGELREVYIPPLVTEIGVGAFAYCHKLLKVVFLPNSKAQLKLRSHSFGEIYSQFDFITNNRSIAFNEWVFHNSSVTSIDLAFDQEVIFDGFLRECPYIRSVLIPDCVTSLNFRMFFICPSLRCIELSRTSKLVTIDESCFVGTNVSNIYIPPSVTSIQKTIFSEDILNPRIYYDGKGFTYTSFHRTPRIYITESWSLETNSMMIKLTAQEFQNNAHRCMESLEDNEVIFKHENVVYSLYQGHNKLVVGERKNYATAGKLIGKVTIPYEVEFTREKRYDVVGIGRYAYYNCTGLCDVLIGPGMRFIEEYAFYNCCNLAIHVMFLYGLNIGNYAFFSCKKIRGFIIFDYTTDEDLFPDAYIGDYAFCDCHRLHYFNYESNNRLIQRIGNCAFKNCYILNDFGELLNANITEIDSYAFQSSKINDIRLNIVIRKIGEGAFNNCTHLSKISFAVNRMIEEIPSNCFSYCTSLTSIALPMSIKRIGDFAFYECRELYNITLGVTEKIGFHAFYGALCYFIYFDGFDEPLFNCSFVCSTCTKVIFSNRYYKGSFCGICVGNDCRCNAINIKRTPIQFPRKQQQCIIL